jgi:hypothetical protein
MMRYFLTSPNDQVNFEGRILGLSAAHREDSCFNAGCLDWLPDTVTVEITLRILGSQAAIGLRRATTSGQRGYRNGKPSHP